MRHATAVLAAAIAVLLGSGLMAASSVDEPVAATTESRAPGVAAATVDPAAPGAHAPEVAAAPPVGTPGATPAKAAAPVPGAAPVVATGAEAPAHDPTAVYRSGDLALRTLVTPSCLAPGQSGIARIEAVPGAYVSLVLAYANGKTYGAMYAGPTDPNGVLEYPFVVPPEAPEGEGSALSAGTDPATDRKGTSGAPFRVTKVLATC